MRKNNEVKELKKIHYKCRELLDNKDYEGCKDYMLSFVNKESYKIEINELKTILIVTQGLKEHEILKDTIQIVQDCFNKTVKKYEEGLAHVKVVLEKNAEKEGLTVREILERLEKGLIKINHQGHNSFSVQTENLDKNVIEEIKRYIEQSEEVYKELPNNFLSALNAKGKIEFGKYIKDLEIYCWDCDARSYVILTNENTITLIPSNSYWDILEKEFGKNHYGTGKKIPPHLVPTCEFKKHNIIDKFVTEIEVPTGELIIANFFNKKDILEKEDYSKPSINSLLGRYNLMQDLSKHNIGCGQMSNMSFSVYKKEDGTELIFHNHYYYDEEKDEEVKVSYEGYIKVGSVCCDMWRWECADKKVLQEIKEYLPSNLKPDSETITPSKEHEMIHSRYSYIQTNVKPGTWVIEHYFDLNRDDFSKIYSKLYLKQ